MSVIGIELEPSVLVFTKNRDFKWTFVNLDSAGNPINFPSGYLYFEFDTSPTKTQWPFTISGSTASITVLDDLVDDIPNRCKWQLVFNTDIEDPDHGGDPIAYGKVVIQE